MQPDRKASAFKRLILGRAAWRLSVARGKRKNALTPFELSAWPVHRWLGFLRGKIFPLSFLLHTTKSKMKKRRTLSVSALVGAGRISVWLVLDGRC